MPKVIILGGGVAGLSAAHELVNRGFDVEIYERNAQYYGGKARSIAYNSSGKYKNPLPGEHGFRFFPGFYKHVTDTMKGIPYPTGRKNKSVYDNLVPTSRIMIARYGKPPIITTASFPKNISDIKLLIQDILQSNETGLSSEEETFFAERVWQLMTSCDDRKNNDYERLSWWQYTQADKFSYAYRSLLVDGLTRTLVAAKAEEASTKTGGGVFLQLLFTMTDPSLQTDRVLNGPTNERWLFSWVDYLKSKNVKFTNDVEAVEVVMKNNEVDHVVIAEGNLTKKVNADYYIMAMPVERAAPLINKEMIQTDGRLAFIKDLAPSTAWMNGIQYYLKDDIVINKGHIICSDSEWALTAISQLQFWEGFDISQHGNGKVKGVLSIDISNWNTPGKFTTTKSANNCTLKEVHKEVWAQLKESFNVSSEVLKDDMVIDYYLDRDIAEKSTNDLTKTELTNQEPLLVNKVNTWSLRPDASSYIGNLFFASDYVRTNTDLATMEGANEAARRAVNCILDDSNSSEDECDVWKAREPWCFEPIKWYDQLRYNKGLSWSIKTPKILKGLTALLVGIYMLTGIIKSVLIKYIFDPILRLLPNMKHKTEKVFILFTMAITLGIALLDATLNIGYQSATILSFSMYIVIAIAAFSWQNILLKKLLLFGLIAGFTELIADNWLVNDLGSLFYPAAQTHIWASPFYMPFAWAVILIQVGYLSGVLAKGKSLIKSIGISFVIGMAFIPIFETCAKYAGWWHYDSNATFLNTPYYIILGEGLICIALPLIFNKLSQKSLLGVTLMGVLQGLWIFAAYYIGFQFLGK